MVMTLQKDKFKGAGKWFHQPVDAATLGFFRMCWGFMMVLEALARFSKVTGVYSPTYFHFKYPLFTWVEGFPTHWMVAVEIVVLLVAAIGVFLGIRFRLATIVFGFVYLHLFLIDTVYYNNHYYLTILISWLLAFTGADRTFSIRSLRERDPDGCAIPHTVPFWNYFLLRGQIFFLYFYGGIAKLNGDWFRAQPVKHWFANSGSLRFPLDLIAREEWFAWVAAYGGIIIDLGAPFLLLWRRTRPYTATVLIAFHLMNSRIFKIGFFPYIGIVLTILFFDPSTARRLWAKFQTVVAGAPRVRMPNLEEVKNTSKPARWAPWLVGGFLLFQAVFPLRAYIVNQDPAWTEVGHKFSWRMMLRSKDAYIKFIFDNPEAELWLDSHPETRPKIASEHIAMLSKHPWMLLQYARELDRVLADNGMPDTRISVISVVSLNDRAYQVMIDPTVDLTEIDYPIWSMPDWIVPLKAEPLGNERPITKNERLEAIRTALVDYAESHPDKISKEKILVQFQGEEQKVAVPVPMSGDLIIKDE